MSSFLKLGVKPAYVRAINELGIFEPSPVQEQAIPKLINSVQDMVVQAQTGTGKTAAFGLPLLHHINPKSKAIQVLILCPTRELGQQAAKQLFKFTKYLDYKVFTEAVYGGEHISVQLSRLARTTHVLVATPGRLVDLMKRETVNLSQVKTVVLDEADEMLHLGFKSDLEFILTQTVKKKQTWLFSATMPKGVKVLISNYLNPNAAFIQASKQEIVNTKIEHQYVVVREHDKLDMLLQFLKSQGNARGVIFCTTKKGAVTLTKQLKAKNFNCDALQGDMLQKEREKVIRAIKNKSIQLLVSTDVSARGIDIPGLHFVVHFDVPSHHEFYTHRSGRTARGGNRGIAISFVTSNQVKALRAIEKELKINIHQIR